MDKSEIVAPDPVTNIDQSENKDGPAVSPVPNQLKDKGSYAGLEGIEFLEAGDSPPALDLISDGLIHEFRGTNSEDPTNFSVQCASRLEEFWELERDMTGWYNDFFFENNIDDRKNWINVWKGGYYASYISERDRWVRVFLDDIIYADGFDDYTSGIYDCVVVLLDYGVFEVIPRRYLLPLRESYIKLPCIGFFASLHFADSENEKERGFSNEITTAFKADTVKYKFKAIITEQYNTGATQNLKLIILENEKDVGKTGSGIYTVRGLLNCGYKVLS